MSPPATCAPFGTPCKPESGCAAPHAISPPRQERMFGAGRLDAGEQAMPVYGGLEFVVDRFPGEARQLEVGTPGIVVSKHDCSRRFLSQSTPIEKYFGNWLANVLRKP